MRLLIVADDLTGAMDTGIKFADKGIAVQVFPNAAYPADRIREETEAVVVNTCSRHLGAGEAFRIVLGVVRDALAAGCTAVYKKTDSGLRGLPGAEIAAACEAAGCGAVLAPALPAAGRVTSGGIHYCDGVPVAESAFGADPIDPVRHSAVTEILAETAPEGIRLRTASGPGSFLPDGREIVVCDAQTKEDLAKIALTVITEAGEDLPVLCGCAGFADALSEVLPFTVKDRTVLPPAPQTLLLSGSLHPVTEQQLRTARTAGVFCEMVNAAAMLEPAEFEKGAGDAAEEFDQVLSALGTDRRAAFAVAREEAREDAAAAAWAKGIPAEKIPVLITDTLAAAAAKALKRFPRLRLFMTGGDTLQAVLDSMDIPEIRPLAELSAGIVEMELCLPDGRTVRAVSKAGGLGSSDAVARILTEA